ncbi:facilitated trehalose transporter Tret1-like [Atheta coriaria]|uniref:facilitated trehalose transporter Tret1-like n=1 Tax=Dalotia coriaria TaxID=877792 RepID=UPI0031F3A911
MSLSHAKLSKSNHDITHTKLLNDSQSSSQESISPRSIFAQCLVTMAVMLSSASCGMPIGYSAILLPQLKNSNDTLLIDDEIGSWIASVHSAATPLGALLSGVLMERCGRKSALQISALPLVIGWLLIGFAHNHALILIGRLIAGMSAGLCAAPGQVLIGETSEPHVRGIFSSIPFASYSFGILLVYAMGTFLDWRTVAGLSTLLPLFAAIVFFFLPESPVWLVKQQRDQDAKEALIWLRGGDVIQAKQELQELVSRVESTDSSDSSTCSTWKLLLQPSALKPFIIINVFNVMQVLSGTYLIVFYAVDILSSLGQSSEPTITSVNLTANITSNLPQNHIDSFLAAVLTAGVRFTFTIVGTIFLGLMGRRTLALTSGIGTGISAIAIAVFLNQNLTSILSSYAVSVGVLIYVALNTVGFMILPGVMIGELYPLRVRGFAGGLTFTFFNFFLFGVAKCFPFVRKFIGMQGVFWVFGTSSMVASVFLYLMLPETKGKTLAQIEDYFSGDNLLWVNKAQQKNRRSRSSSENA